MNSNPIDFVLLWVDPSDKEWQKERNKHQDKKIVDKRGIRYRDWDNLQYLFRGIEKFAPWVNKVHFITYGHLPKWLNVNHPKLNIVNHKDYIPSEYLPTFNSDPIELNLHRITELSENFVLFNDDMFLLSSLEESDVFKNNLPCDSALLNVHCYDSQTMFTLAPFVNIGVINKYYDMHKVMKSNFKVWFNPIYGINMLRNIYLQPCPRFPGLRMDHLPCSHLKSTFNRMWELEYDLLNASSMNKFRSKTTVNHWLMKEWNIVSNQFVPRSLKIGKSFGITTKNIDTLADYIEKQKSKYICLNDTEMSEKDFLLCKQKLIVSFNRILPERSQFEL